MTQTRLFDLWTIADLRSAIKEGKPCPCCGHVVLIRWITMDDWGVKLLWQILNYCKEAGTKRFRFKDVFGQDIEAHPKIAHIQRAKYWNIIKKPEDKPGSDWQFTSDGLRFMSGLTRLPKRQAVYNDQNVTEQLFACINRQFDEQNYVGSQRDPVRDEFNMTETDDDYVSVADPPPHWQTTPADYFTDVTRWTPGRPPAES